MVPTDRFFQPLESIKLAIHWSVNIDITETYMVAEKYYSYTAPNPPKHLQPGWLEFGLLSRA